MKWWRGPAPDAECGVGPLRHVAKARCATSPDEEDWIDGRSGSV